MEESVLALKLLVMLPGLVICYCYVPIIPTVVPLGFSIMKRFLMSSPFLALDCET